MSEYHPNAVLTAREDLNHELAIFRIRPEGWQLPSFQPGQYAELAIPEESPEPGKKLLRRSYSIASAPSRADELEFYIVRVEGGELTPRLWDLRVGDSLWLGPKIKGKFTLNDVPPGSDVVMVATGTGLAPFLSMLREHESSPTWRRAVIIHGARFVHDLGYREELKDFERRRPWFRYLSTLTREPERSSWGGYRGRVQHLFTDGPLIDALGEPPSLERTHFLLCGNPQMIDDIEGLLGAKGFKPHRKKEPGNIHVERYW